MLLYYKIKYTKIIVYPLRLQRASTKKVIRLIKTVPSRTFIDVCCSLSCNRISYSTRKKETFDSIFTIIRKVIRDLSVYAVVWPMKFSLGNTFKPKLILGIITLHSIIS